MKDGYNRNINCLSISLTDRCNLNCVHCSERVDTHRSKNNLSIYDYKFIIENLSKMGINKLELTGEASVLDFELAELVDFAKTRCNIEHIELNTNGVDFYKYAKSLKEAGLDKVNISLNSLKGYRYESMTKGGNLSDVLKSFDESIRLGFDVQIETLIINGFNSDEILDFIEIAKNFSVSVKFFELVKVGGCKGIYEYGYIDIEAIMDHIEELDKFEAFDTTCKCYYGNKSMKGIVGIVPASYKNKCLACNKLIVSYDKRIRHCRYSSEEYDISDKLHKPLTFAEFMKYFMETRPRGYEEVKDSMTSRNLNEL